MTLDIHILTLIGLAGFFIIFFVIYLIFFVRLYEKVDRLDTSDSQLHLLIGRIETINESAHREIDFMHRDLCEYADRMVHIDRFLGALAQVDKEKKSGSNPDDNLTVHCVATEEKK